MTTPDTIASLGGALGVELGVAFDVALAAGQLVAGYHGSDLTIERKEDDEPVTVADRESSELVCEALAARFPADVIISEERADDPRRDGARRVWYIDPVDGTSDFIKGDRDFCVMIGLVIDGVPSLGVVHQPLDDFTYLAASGSGAHRIESSGPPTRMTCSSAEALGDLRVVVSKSHRAVVIDDVLKALGGGRENNVGSVGLKLGLLARGLEDVYVGPSRTCSSWDTAAPAAILHEAGGRITDLGGAPLRYDRESMVHDHGLLGSNGLLHDRLVRALSPLFANGVQA